jgi:poly-gamma-glutamate capsule biosynthesis protein CapA/YwtB (metallophosphatase superfamily)
MQVAGERRERSPQSRLAKARMILADVSTEQAITLALAGDTMLGRGVAERLRAEPAAELLAPEVVAIAAEADRFVLNLECCISARGSRWRDPGKPFFFRAPPEAAERLAEAGVDAVTLGNNHALDFGPDALLDTLDHLYAAGIVAVGAGVDELAARACAHIGTDGFRLRLVAFTDHPRDYAAAAHRPGVAYADLRAGGLPGWLADTVAPGDDADAVVVLPHWGPNMTSAPLPAVRGAAAAPVGAGATLVAGTSAHIFHGAAGRVLFDLGDFLDDYRVDPRLRNDLGLLWLVTLDREGPRRVEAVPLRLHYCHTALAAGEDARWIARRLAQLCDDEGTAVRQEDERLVLTR